MPQPAKSSKRMSSSLKSFIKSGASLFTPSSLSTNLAKQDLNTLFPSVDPAIDGEDCIHDCLSCTIKYPKKWSIDEEEEIYGHVKGWATQLLVATGKADWVRDVEDEKGSVMEALVKGNVHPTNGRLMLSASNMVPPQEYYAHPPGPKRPTTVLLLPAFTLIENVTPASVPELVTHYINPAPTTTTPLYATSTSETATTPSPALTTLSAPSHPFRTKPCPHAAVVLLCSQRTRDARCGQSAPLLQRELERHLRPLGLYRDAHDDRPGGVGIYFISHVGGHKFAANVIVYRRGSGGAVDDDAQSTVQNEENLPSPPPPALPPSSSTTTTTTSSAQTPQTPEPQGAAQAIWLARVRPEDCENIVKYTILAGKVVKPATQLRGGFDRERGVVSW
ncbi:MAG: hypothetical protein M1819_005547 [Sarea resinae]|nr:MAG: hypothetical protein M1819_005547 [Sarea resinae]